MVYSVTMYLGGEVCQVTLAVKGDHAQSYAGIATYNVQGIGKYTTGALYLAMHTVHGLSCLEVVVLGSRCTAGP